MIKNSQQTDSTPVKNAEGLSHELEELKTLLFLAKEVLTLEEAAIYLGISKSSLYKMTHSRSIPFYKPNNKLVYFERSELLEWVRQGRVATDEELTERAKSVMRELAMRK